MSFKAVVRDRVRFVSSLVGLVFASGCDVGSSTVHSVKCEDALCAGAAQQANTCVNGDQILVGKYRMLNNTWGVQRTNIPGQQCMWSNCSSGSSISWGTNYDWIGGPSGQVESFTALILGWHFNELSADSGLPVQLSSNRAVNCTWSYKVTNDAKAGTAVQDVAYDIWLASTPTPTGSTVPTDEIMIWLYSSGGASPIGSSVASAKIGDATWGLHEGQNGGWTVHSFLLADNTPCASLNLMDFFNYLADNRGLDRSKYLIGIEAGTEVFSGSGSLDTSLYSCDVE